MSSGWAVCCRLISWRHLWDVETENRTRGSRVWNENAIHNAMSSPLSYTCLFTFWPNFRAYRYFIGCWISWVDKNQIRRNILNLHSLWIDLNTANTFYKIQLLSLQPIYLSNKSGESITVMLRIKPGATASWCKKASHCALLRPIVDLVKLPLEP